MTQLNQKNSETGLEIAVIGISGRFPGARNIDEFWENLKNGIESISFFSDQELKEEGIQPEMLENPNYIKARGIFASKGYFDSSFFDYLPKEAEIMDPQVRLFHECSWEALESAGYNPASYNGSIGIYAGLTPNLNWIAANLVQENGGLSGFEAAYLNSNFFVTLISYKLNLSGPAVVVQTACSTSLSAIHQACRALLTGECHMALAGGVTLGFPGKFGYIYQEGMILSPDGSCRAFDAKAKGTIDGEGVGIVLLKRLDAAIIDEDNIHAVIKGSALNNDGNRKVGYTAPSVEGQVEVIKAAQLMAEVKPESISYIETHGTGTTFGDPIEIEALKRVFQNGNANKKKICAIGSVKTNIGHLDSAAGVAGFIKAVLALKHRLIPPSLHFENPNPKIDFKNSPFYVNTGLREWENNRHPLRAGVSSFGIGGTNAHAVLEEAPLAQSAVRKAHGTLLILLSAKTQTALDKMTQNLAEHFKKHPDINLADAAYTLQVGRQPFEFRRMWVCPDVTQAIKNLSSLDSADLYSFAATGENRPVVFMFPGQGSQYVNMGRELYEKVPLFREEMNRCFQILNGLLDYDIKEILYPSPVTNHPSPDINQTEIAQPLLFIIEYALAKLLIKWGIEPYAMIGHSIGEYVAACLSGVFSLENALKLMALRGKLMQQLPGGAMLSVSLSENHLESLLELNGELSLAAVNSISHCVVSGPHQAIEAFNQQLQEKGYESKLLHTSHAFHSNTMDPILEEYENKVKQIPLNPPGKPYISNLTGTWITVEQAIDPGYWARHLRKTVRFSHGLQTLLKENQAIFIEVGPGSVLSTFARQNSDKNTEPLVMNLVRHPREKIPDDGYLLTRIGQLWLYGRSIDWKEFYSGEKRPRISLPTYPFESRFYWKKAGTIKRSIEMLEASPVKTQKRDLDHWFYVPSWKRSLLSAHKTLQITADATWLVLTQEDSPGNLLLKTLQQKGQQVVAVQEGLAFKRLDAQVYTVNPTQDDDFDNLFRELHTLGKLPRRIVHLWSFKESSPNGLDMNGEWLEKVQNSGFHSLLNIAKAIGKHQINDQIHITVVTNNMQEVTGDEMLNPAHATVLGPIKIIPIEYPNISCRSIDFGISNSSTPPEHSILNQLFEELNAKSSDTIVAYRGNHRWVQTFEPIRPDKPTGIEPRLKEKGVYLVTGGLGGIGLTLAEYLAGHVKARLILTGRSDFPARENWNQWLSSHDKQDPVSLKIGKMQKIEELGGQVLVFSADAANLLQMKEVITAAEERYGLINGVIHSAGLPDGGLIQTRNREMTERILAAKVKGTLILDHLLKDKKIDFFFFCSSLNAVLPQLGQVAYCAANAFMDAFAHYKTSTDGQFTVSVNWDAWQEVGMAVEAVKKLWPAKDSQKPPSQDVAHPLFDYRVVENPDQVVYVTYFRVTKHWVLDEHRIMGRATLPGTAYIEMVRAAFADHTGTELIEIREMLFLTPLMMDDQEEKEVHTIIKKQENDFEFRLISKARSDEDNWVEHTRGQIALPEPRELKKQEIQKIIEKCNKNEITVTEEMMTAGNDKNALLPHFGPRWFNLRKISFGAGQVLVELELPEAFADDCRLYKLHPALMDAAVGSYNDKNTIVSGDASLPFSYKRLRVDAHLPRKIYSYIRPTGTNQEGKRLLKFNITIMDEQGRQLVEIEEYTRLVVSGDAKTRIAENKPILYTEKPTPVNHLQKNYPLKDGIMPAEGIDVFNRILGSSVPQVVVSTLDLVKWLEQNNRSNKSSLIEALEPIAKKGPRRSRPTLNRPYVAPRNETEQTLAQTWEEFFGLEQVGIHDDFFELGGDSLKAINFVSKIHKNLDVEVPLGQFFNHSTVAGIAGYVNNTKKSKHFNIPLVEKKEYYPLSSDQERIYILNRMAPHSTAYNLNEVLQVTEKGLNLEKVETIFIKMIKRHESLKTKFETIDGRPIQRIDNHVGFNIEYYDMKEVKVKVEEERSLVNRKNLEGIGGGAPLPVELAASVIENFIRPFDLSQAPLLRVGMIKLDEEKHLLMIDIHHIISDGFSLQILFGDFLSLHDGLELPGLSTTYKDYSEWQRKKKEQGSLKQQEAYWFKQFEGKIPLLNLPTDYARPAIMSFEGSELEFLLNRDESLALKKLALEEGVTMYMLLLAVFNVLMAKLCGQTDIIVGAPIAGRNHTDLQNIVGMFVNTLALRNYPLEYKTFKEFLKEVGENTLKAFENQDYQFESLVENLNLKRDTSRNPLFNTTIEQKNLEAETGVLPQLQTPPELAKYGYKKKTTILDLNVIVANVGENLHFSVEYSTKLFKKERIERFIVFFKEIIKAILENRELQLKDYTISHTLGVAASNMPETDFEF